MVNAVAARKVRPVPYRRVIVTALALVAIGTMALPWVVAGFGGSYYYVAGLDMVFGREVPTDQYGMLPQLGPVLTFLFLIASALLTWLHPRREKGAFLSGLFAAAAFLMLLVPLRPDENQGQFDPVIMAFTQRHLQYGYYLSLLAVAVLIAASVWNILSHPDMVKDLKYSKWLYVLAVPVLIYVFVFFYYPIYGVLIAFKDFSPRLGILGSPFVGFKHFLSFFDSYYFERLIVNTLMISFLDILFGFSSPIIFALLLNEVRSSLFKRTIQTVTYLPHFVSLVVLCGLVKKFTAGDGLINQILMMFGVPKSSLTNYLMEADYFRTVYTASGIWQSLGWNSIMYLAALTQIDPALYEAARVDGAKRWRLMLHVSIPGILPTIIVLFILRLGSVMNVGFEKIILLYSEPTYKTADVISSFVYRRGIGQSEYSFATAIDLFNQIINLILVLVTNRISSKVSEISLW